MSEVSLGHQGYNAYGEHMRWYDARGMRMLRWEQLSETQRRAWEKQAEVIRKAVLRQRRTPGLKIHGLTLPGDRRSVCGLLAAGMKVTTDRDQVTCGSCILALKGKRGVASEQIVNGSAGEGIS